MNKKNIIGDARVIENAKKALPGDKSVYINWDAINELPDEYEAVITEIKFDARNLAASFSDVGNGTWMPTPETHYKIAEARGIEGCPESLLEPIYEDVNISEMLLDDTPRFVNMLTGYRCRKQSVVIEEDGTTRRSSPCTIDYNVWNRCCEAWAKEESYTKGYTQAGKFEPKYNDKHKRKAHFYAELKFAMQKAETKAHEKTIRELAGLMTGYKTADLQKGSLVFAKIRRSRDVLRLETAARLEAISRGHQNQGAAALLFGPAAAPELIKDPVAEPVTQPQQEVIDVEPKELMSKALETYIKENLITDDSMKQKALATIDWLNVTDRPETKAKGWGIALDFLKKVEEAPDFPEFAKVAHGLY